jgi:adenylate kinase family enzyme
MVNYANGKIYKICPISGEDECYIGSTTKKYLSTRMSTHRHKYIKKLKGSESRILFDKYGIENCKIVLIKKFPCTCKEELDAEEAKHIKNNNCVNKNIPGRTKKQYRQDNKEKAKQYRQDHKEYFKQYYQNNKEQIKEKSKIKYHCICGSILTINCKARHERTTKHIKGEQAFYDGCEQALLELNNNK